MILKNSLLLQTLAGTLALKCVKVGNNKVLSEDWNWNEECIPRLNAINYCYLNS
jgi:hypothetical protein